MLPEVLAQVVREAGGDALLLDARKGRALLTDTSELKQVCRKLKNAGFARMVDSTAQHVGQGEGGEDEFALFLTLRHPAENHAALTLKWKWIQAEDTVHPTLSRIWPAAGLAEREIFEMLGIPFDENDNLVPLLLDEQFAGNPLKLGFEDKPREDYAAALLKERHEQAMLDAARATLGGGG
ncbi:NADH-quinone oxidoreductase subunit C [bacterium]|nr:NADH-quinone oxidoreductase subunit C [bacterium]